MTNRTINFKSYWSSSDKEFNIDDVSTSKNLNRMQADEIQRLIGYIESLKEALESAEKAKYEAIENYLYVSSELESIKAGLTDEEAMHLLTNNIKN